MTTQSSTPLPYKALPIACHSDSHAVQGPSLDRLQRPAPATIPAPDHYPPSPPHPPLPPPPPPQVLLYLGLITQWIDVPVHHVGVTQEGWVCASPDLLEQRHLPRREVERRPAAVHLYGVDLMSTAECLGYFAEWGPTFCEWINDSSCESSSPPPPPLPNSPCPHLI